MCHRKRKLALLLAGILTLSACGAPVAETSVPPLATRPEAATPSPAPTPEPTHQPVEAKELWGFPIDDTHDAFEVPTGGKLGTVLVTVEMNEEEFISTVSVWDASDLTAPIQTMEEEGAAPHRRELLDANFDGYMDFTYIWASGAKNNDFGLYIWNEEEGRFLSGGNFLGHLEVDEEKKAVLNHSNGAGSSGTTEIFRWEDGKLSCVRQIEIHYPETKGENITQLLTVEEYVNGEWTEIGWETCGAETNIYDKASLWYDLDYRGEAPETLWGFPIDDTHDAFEVPTGGKLGTVLVTVELMDAEGTFFEEQHFSVWTSNDLINPLQTMTAEDVTCFKWKDIRDANFDGYIDFGYMFAMGNQPAYYHYWIWDEEQGQFVAEPEFDRISWPQFDEETGVISGWARSSCCSGIETYHCWEDGKLVCVRQIELHYPEHNEDGTFNQLATVEDRINGELTEVFREYCTNEKQSDTYPFEEVRKWYDLNYQGE